VDRPCNKVVGAAKEIETEAVTGEQPKLTLTVQKMAQTVGKDQGPVGKEIAIVFVRKNDTTEI
jgi:hypothetical protein